MRYRNLKAGQMAEYVFKSSETNTVYATLRELCKLTEMLADHIGRHDVADCCVTILNASVRALAANEEKANLSTDGESK